MIFKGFLKNNSCLIITIGIIITCLTLFTSDLSSWGDYKTEDGFATHSEDSCALFKISKAAQSFMLANQIRIDSFAKNIYIGNKVFNTIIKTAFAVSIRRHSTQDLAMIVFYSPIYNTNRGSYPRTEYIITKDDIYTIDEMREFYVGNVYQLMNEFVVDDGWNSRRDYKIVLPKTDVKPAEKDDDDEKDDDEKKDDDAKKDTEKTNSEKDKANAGKDLKVKHVNSFPKPKSYIDFSIPVDEVKKPVEKTEEKDDDD